MATLISAIRSRIRTQLVESTATYWTDDEIDAHVIAGIKDLWKRINDTYENYFATVDITNVSLAASSNTLTGVPADVFTVVTLEPRVLGESNPNPGLVFKPADYNSPQFTAARGVRALDPKNCVIYYALFAQGAPVSAPTIRVAPQVSSAVNLTLVYNATLATLTGASNNPIPGESDNALFAWGIAYCRAKEREDAAPDPEWLAVYATEKTALIQALAPRQTQEPEVAEAMFEEQWD